MSGYIEDGMEMIQEYQKAKGRDPIKFFKKIETGIRKPANKLKVLSFGGGMQTVTLATMCCYGDFEMPDFAVFADTGWET